MLTLVLGKALSGVFAELLKRIMKRRVQQEEEALQCGCPDNSNMWLVQTVPKALQVGHMKNQFFFTCWTHVSHYSTRITDIAPSKREKATTTHRKLVFKYILCYICVHILKLSML